MSDAEDGPPVVTLPERFDRRLRLGPFASARDALRFVTYAAVGAVLAPFTGPYLWLGVVLTGFAACVVRSEGESLDERAFAFVRWTFRTRSGPGPMTDPGLRSQLRKGLVPLGDERQLAILGSGGTPISYLPPVELARRFDSFRSVLRSLDGALAFWVFTVPMRSRSLVPDPPTEAGPDAAARAAYSELVRMICRRRRVRRVYLALGTERVGPDAVPDLERRAAALAERLDELGVSAVRLRDGALLEAARRWGWA